MTTPKTEALLPCPFCGGEAKINYEHQSGSAREMGGSGNYSLSFPFVSCKNGHRGRSWWATSDGTEAAIKEWNTRLTPSPEIAVEGELTREQIDWLWQNCELEANDASPVTNKFSTLCTMAIAYLETRGK